MPRTKKTTKKTTKKAPAKKTTKRAYTRKAKPVTLDNVVEAAHNAGAIVDVKIQPADLKDFEGVPSAGYEFSATQACEGTSAALRSRVPMGLTTALTQRLQRIELSPTDTARAQLLHYAHKLVDAEIAVAKLSSGETVFRARTLAAQAQLASAEFDEAISAFEAAIRG